MISLEDARRVAQQHLIELEPAVGMELVLLDNATLEREFGWVFFYNSRTFVETGNFSDCLTGNAPIIVERLNGQIHETGTALPIEHYIEEFERTHSDPGQSSTER